MNTIIYATDDKIKRLNVDEMRRKMKRSGEIVRNESLDEAQDFRSTCNYDSDKDDVCFYVDEELGF